MGWALTVLLQCPLHCIADPSLRQDRRLSVLSRIRVGSWYESRAVPRRINSSSPRPLRYSHPNTINLRRYLTYLKLAIHPLHSLPTIPILLGRANLTFPEPQQRSHSPIPPLGDTILTSKLATSPCSHSTQTRKSPPLRTLHFDSHHILSVRIQQHTNYLYRF